MEPDHSALIGKTMQQYPALTLVCSKQTVKMLAYYFDYASFSDRIRCEFCGCSKCSLSRSRSCDSA
jgi:hypothetical protein